jgi:hypothetical protein
MDTAPPEEASSFRRELTEETKSIANQPRR